MCPQVGREGVWFPEGPQEKAGRDGPLRAGGSLSAPRGNGSREDVLVGQPILEGPCVSRVGHKSRCVGDVGEGWSGARGGTSPDDVRGT